MHFKSLLKGIQMCKVVSMAYLSPALNTPARNSPGKPGNWWNVSITYKGKSSSAVVTFWKRKRLLKIPKIFLLLFFFRIFSYVFGVHLD